MDDCVVLVLDLTRENEWDRIFDGAQRAFGGVGVRRTTSSRTPGKVNQGVVRRRHEPQIEACAACGTQRYDLGGPHGLQMMGVDSAVDCVGVAWVLSNGAWERKVEPK